MNEYNNENIILISHEDTSKDITKRGGDKITAIKPNLQEKAANKVAGMVDMVARIIADDNKRTLSFKSDEVVFGGGRLTTSVNEIDLDYDTFLEVYEEANKTAVARLKEEEKPKTTSKEENEEKTENEESEQPKTRNRRNKKSEEMTTEEMIDNIPFAEDEAEIIRIIYDKFVNTTMGMAAIAAFLNNSGYKKKLRQNNTIEGFSTSFVKGVLDNPIYCGKLAFGRRKNEKIPGTRNEYHIVKQKDYLLSDGVHEAIISEEMWNQAHRKRQETGVLQVKTHSLEHEHILSGIIKCPVCGSGMYGNVNRKKHPDGGYYKDYFYYACKHRKLVDGHRCTYKRQWNEDRINAAVEEIIRKFVKNPKFEQEIRKQIGSSIDTSELNKEYDGLKDRLSQTTGAKNRLADQMDHLSVSDKNYDKKYNDMQERLDKLYDEITDIEDAMEEVETRLYNIRQDKISEDNVYQFLLFFDKLYDKFTDLEKKTFLKSFLSDVFIYEEEQKDGRILKGLRFKFPIYMNGRNVLGVDWDNESTDGTVILLS